MKKIIILSIISLISVNSLAQPTYNLNTATKASAPAAVRKQVRIIPQQIGPTPSPIRAQLPPPIVDIAPVQ